MEQFPQSLVAIAYQNLGKRERKWALLKCLGLFEASVGPAAARIAGGVGAGGPLAQVLEWHLLVLNEALGPQCVPTLIPLTA